MFKLLMAAALVATGLLLPGAAVAKPDVWVDNPVCTAGSFGDLWEARTEGAYAVVTVPGELNCGGPRTTMWGASVAEPGERTTHVLASMLAGYATTAPTTFQVTVPVSVGAALIVCVHPGPVRTLACVRVSVGVDGAVTVTDEPADGWPTVVRQEPIEYHTQPQCNTCWTTEPL